MTRLATVLGPLIEALKREIFLGALKIGNLWKTIYQIFCISIFSLISMVVLLFEEKYSFEDK